MDIYQKLQEHPELEEYLSFYLKHAHEIRNNCPQKTYFTEKCIEYVVNAYDTGKLTLEDFDDKLNEMMTLLNDIISALTSFSDNLHNEHKKNKKAKKDGIKRDKDAEKKTFYSFKYLVDSIYAEDIEISNISISQLNDCIYRYLKMDWFKLKEIELILADAYIRYCLKVNRESWLRNKYGIIASACLFLTTYN